MRQDLSGWATVRVNCLDVSGRRIAPERSAHYARGKHHRSRVPRWGQASLRLGGSAPTHAAAVAVFESPPRGDHMINAGRSWHSNACCKGVANWAALESGAPPEGPKWGDPEQVEVTPHLETAVRSGPG